jgi:hypothetical protein
MDNYESFNPNPYGKRVGDCTVRAVSKALNQSWEKTYDQLNEILDNMAQNGTQKKEKKVKGETENA